MPDTPILVLNAGSSSLKYLRSDAGGGSLRGTVGRIGEPAGPADHVAALKVALDRLALSEPPAAIGHRVVHGGPHMREPVRIDAAVESRIDAMSEFAPVHNPPALTVIRAVRDRFPEATQVAVFDTGFHAGMPAVASTYPIDAETASRYGVRRYGFHGISVEHAVGAAAALLDRPAAELNMIVLHLGNGASATAVRGGASVDTSMGMTPLEGLVMGTRSGDLDPSITFHLLRHGMPADDVESLYENRSGLLGLCGDNDMRSVLARAGDGDPAARLAIDVYCYRLKKYVGGYAAALGRLDAIVFTGGIGENAGPIRAATVSGLGLFGIELDAATNEAGSGPRVISSGSSRVAVCVVEADEEAAIAARTAQLIGG